MKKLLLIAVFALTLVGCTPPTPTLNFTPETFEPAIEGQQLNAEIKSISVSFASKKEIKKRGGEST